MTAKPQAIELSGVCFGWQAKRPVIEIPSLSIASGEKVFIEGPSGAGKSTLLSLLAGIAKPQSGIVSVFGTDLGRLREAERDRFRADRMGVIFQLFNLLPYLSMADNVALPCRFSPKRALRTGATPRERNAAAIDLLGRLGMGDLARSTRGVASLSVGQQQRVAAARALIGEPDLIIADEPTSALDAKNRGTFIETLLREVERTSATLIFVSHDPGLASHFDRAIQLQTLNQAAMETS